MKTNFLKITFFLLLAFQLSAQSIQNFSEQGLFENGTNGYACYRIPAIINSPSGRLLAFAEGRVNGCGDFGNVDIVLKTSDDNGKTWSAQKVLADFGKLQAGNPAPVVDFFDPRFPKGRIFLFYNTGIASEHETREGKGLREVFYISSIDEGKTWSSPENITQQVHFPKRPDLNAAYNSEKDWRSYANSPGHAIQLEKGRYKGRLFIPANHSAGTPQEKFNDYRAHAFYSDDHGKTWNLSKSVEVPSSNESIAVELPNGVIMQNIRHQSGTIKERLVALSRNGGTSWDTTYFDSKLITPICQASILNFKTPNNKNVLLFSNPASSKGRENMTVRISFDDGKTWLLSRVVREGESAYSDLVAQADGQIGLLYEHGSNGGIFYAQFNYEWLTNGKNHTDNAYVQKVKGKGDVAQNFQFQLASPHIESDQIIFKKTNEVKLKLEYRGVRIHYTLDGTTPNENSLIFNKNIKLEKTAVLKARAFHDACLPSEVKVANFIKLNDQLAIKAIKLINPPNEKYPGTGANSLIDLEKGSFNFQEDKWMGFSGNDIEINIEFEKPTNFNKLTASMLANNRAWIFLPNLMKASISDDGKKYREIGTQKFIIPKKETPESLEFLDLKFETQKSKFLKIVIKPIPALPEWHAGKGLSPWMFIDEIIIE